MLLIVAKEDKYINNLLNKLEYTKENVDNINVYNCKYMDHNFLIIITSYGKVNVASSLIRIFNKYRIRVIVQMGTCQSISNDLDILNAVIYKGALQYDVDFSPLGYSPSIFPFMDTGIYFTNDDLRKCMEDSCSKCNVNYTNNLISSADMFVSNNNLAKSVRVCFNSSSIDDYSGTIGQIAYINKIPFVGINIVSSYANNNAVKLYNLYDNEASSICQKIVYKFIKEYYS